MTSISQKLKFDYLKNEKSFQCEIKTFFLVSQVLSFRYTKQSSEKLVDTTFTIISQALPSTATSNVINISRWKNTID